MKYSAIYRPNRKSLGVGERRIPAKGKEERSISLMERLVDIFIRNERLARGVITLSPERAEYGRHHPGTLCGFPGSIPTKATSASIETLESPRERVSVVGYSFITLPDQEKWSGDGAGIKAITGGDAVAIDPKYRDAYSAYNPAVILAVNNNPMRFSDRSGGVSRRRVILTFPEVIPAKERDPQLLDKISAELAVI
ncbi:hypothetical protein LJN55_00325 [Erwinia rhapontici]|nr:hypothetical protein LJN55_00325 [Erwinia rhapontici]